MPNALERLHALRELHVVQHQIADLEANLCVLVDELAGRRRLAELRAERDALDAVFAEADAPAGFTLTAEQAADHLAITSADLRGFIDSTPPDRRPCIDTATGAHRRHLRFNIAQLERWAQEKPWQASALPTTEAGSSAGGSPTLTILPPESSARGSSPAPKRRPKSTARLRLVRSAPGRGGSPTTGDPDLDALY